MVGRAGHGDHAGANGHRDLYGGGTAGLGGAGHVWMDNAGPGAGIVCDWGTGILPGEPFR